MGTKFYRQKAWSLLSGIWMREIGVALIYFGIYFIVSLVSYEREILSVILNLALIPIGFGYTKRLLDIANGREDMQLADLFYYYTSAVGLNLILLSLIVGLFTFLWSLLFIIPGIIASCAYAIASYIVIDDENIGVMEAVSMSKAMMMGHKMEYFLLSLSFIGWAILATLTVIGWIPFIVYLGLTMAVFYTELRSSIVEEIYEPVSSTDYK